MPWKEVKKMSSKREFVEQAIKSGVNLSELCKRYGISRPTGYQLLKRYKSHGIIGLKERSKRPKNSPTKTKESMEQLILSVRDEHFSWGCRKIYHYLLKQGVTGLPHPNTITDILRRHDRLYDWRQTEPKKPYKRFERAHPNELWQMDFKGHFPLNKQRCHPLTILDDHSRFSIVLEACSNEQLETVRQCLIKVFRRYGLPDQINVDNGPPWGSAGYRGYTQLSVWLMRLGIFVSYSKPHHPETNGKDERFHRTLKQEVLNRYSLGTLDEAQRCFDKWRDEYNMERPHEGLGYEVPLSRYYPSEKPYLEQLPEIEYFDTDIVKQVRPSNGVINFSGVSIFIGYAFKGEQIAIRETEESGVYNIFYCQNKIKKIDMNRLKK